MKSRYDEDTEPNHPRYLLVLEEIQEIRAILGKDTVDPILRQLARQMRGSNGRLMVITQRPDAEDAIPGVVKDMFEDRFILGFVSATGARMVLDHNWRAVVDEYGAETVPGRGVARIGGRLIRLQGFRLDSPRDNPNSDILYPPHQGTTHPHGTQKRAQTAAFTTAGTTPIPRVHERARQPHGPEAIAGQPARRTPRTPATEQPPQNPLKRSPVRGYKIPTSDSY